MSEVFEVKKGDYTLTANIGEAGVCVCVLAPGSGKAILLSPEDGSNLRDWLTAKIGPIKPPVQECVCGRPDNADEPEDEDAHEAAWQAGYVAALQAAAIKADEDEKDDVDLNTLQNLRVWAIDQSTALEAETKVEEAATLVAFVLKGEVA